MTPVVQERLAVLDTLILDRGAHTSFEEGACIMEAVAFVADEPFSDHPKCASPILGAFLRAWNDRLDTDDRQLLKPYIVRLVGTNTGQADEQTRKWMLLDWLVHEYAPAMFRTAGLTAEAEAFEQLAAITGREQWAAARATVYEVRDKAWERRTEARKRAAAVAVADAAAVAATAAVAAAVAAADAAAAADADAAAAAAADAAAYKQAIEAAVDAKKAGGDYWKQRDAAYAVLYPFYKERLAEVAPGLQTSALLLLDRLIDVGQEETAAA
jgi:hypothetical protein